jgi:hypothetical protein
VYGRSLGGVRRLRGASKGGVRMEKGREFTYVEKQWYLGEKVWLEVKGEGSWTG